MVLEWNPLGPKRTARDQARFPLLDGIQRHSPVVSKPTPHPCPDVLVLIPGTCAYGTSRGKRDFAAGTEFGALWYGGCPGLPRGAQLVQL